jgi:class 3 adenylate cyclase
MAETVLICLATLFADIVGSTRLYERFGDQAAHAAVEQCLDRLKEVVAEYEGRTVKTIGDEIMAVFPDAERACLAATEMQWRVQELPSLEGERIEIRIAFHYGSAVERDGDVFGDSVNMAARLAELAKPRQILTSGQALESSSEQISAGARHLWPIAVKGRSEPVDLYEILWDSSDATVTMSAQFAPPRVPLRLRLMYRGSEVVVDPQRPNVSIGRDAGNDVVVDARNASRVHARVEWRRDKFVLIDISTNGTVVAASDGTETRLRREELILDGDGNISFGHSNGMSPRNCVEYYCEYAFGSPRLPAHSMAEPVR